MNKFWTRIFIISSALLLILFFTNDFGLIDIQKTAIVTAIGIDRSSEGAFDVTAQIALPNASGSDMASNVTVQGAQTVGDAIAELNQKTGWYPTLVHCRLILLGNAVAETDVFCALDYFLRSESVEDSCLVAVCNSTAAQTLQAKSPVEDLTANAISKVLSSEAQKTGQVCVTNLRDFAKGYFSEGKSGILPNITARQEAQSESGGQSGSGQSGSGQSGSGQSPLSAANADVFDASQSVLFYEGRRAALLDSEETLAYNLADSNTDLAYGEVTVLEESVPITYTLKIKIAHKSQRLQIEEGIPVLTFRIRANAQVVDANKSSDPQAIAQTTITPEHVLRAAEERFRKELSSVLQKAHPTGCDLFGLKQKLHRFHPRFDSALRDTLLDAVRVQYDIRFQTLR